MGGIVIRILLVEHDELQDHEHSTIHIKRIYLICPEQKLEGRLDKWIWNDILPRRGH